MGKRNVTIVVGGQYGSEGKGRATGILKEQFGSSVLLMEVERYRVGPDRLMIDPLAGIITGETIRNERSDLSSIASTLTGTGAALESRVMGAMTGEATVLARDVPELKPFIGDTKQFLRKCCDDGEGIIIEGTQGYGLSVYSKTWPYCISRDTTESGFLAETGLSPYPLVEYTTVTGRVRRVARFEPELVRRAVMVNRPDVIFMNHVDYVDMRNQGVGTLSDKQERFVRWIEGEIGAPIDWVGNGPDAAIRMR